MNGAQAQSDITTMLTNIMTFISAWYPTISLIASFVGIVFVIKAVMFLAPGRSGKAEVGKTTALFLVGIFLFNVETFLSSVSHTVFGNDGFANGGSTTEVMTYAGTAASASASSHLYIQTGITIVMVVGFVGLIRGLIMLTKLQENPNQFGHAMTHIIGGTLAVNFQTFISSLAKSIGGQVQTVIGGLIQIN